MVFLDATDTLTKPITDVIVTWIHVGQAMVGSIGVLAFVLALACMP